MFYFFKVTKPPKLAGVVRAIQTWPWVLPEVQPHARFTGQLPKGHNGCFGTEGRHSGRGLVSHH